MAQETSERPVVIITGASGGIGGATAKLFASKGWAVVLAARSEGKIRRFSGEIEASGGLALAVEATGLPAERTVPAPTPNEAPPEGRPRPGNKPSGAEGTLPTGARSGGDVVVGAGIDRVISG